MHIFSKGKYFPIFLEQKLEILYGKSSKVCDLLHSTEKSR